jgi:tRNA dimethylallyltransferase
MDLTLLSAQLAKAGLPCVQDWPQHYDAVLISGPTASGKSALSMQLAALWPAGIVSVDSALVYQGMDIGTAKPTLAEQSICPHFLLDLIAPWQTYNVAQFLSDAQVAMNTCVEQGRLPVLVGGTMMYIQALFKGLSVMPSVEAHIRDEIVHQAAIQGWPALHQALFNVDPLTAKRLAPNDAQRIERALAVYKSTQKPLSQWHQDSPNTQAVLGAGAFKRCLHVSIEPEKTQLWHRIEQRFDAMLQAGFLDEVRRLKAHGNLVATMPSMRCVGYRQAWQYLEGELTQEALRTKGAIATRQLAKRQMTWLRSMEDRYVLN